MATTKYGGIKFPFEKDLFKDALVRTTSINETVASAIRCFLITSPGQRRGNTTGSITTSLKHRLIKSSEQKTVADDIKKELIRNFPGISFQEVDITQVVNEEVIVLNLKITFSTPVTQVTELSLQV